MVCEAVKADLGPPDLAIIEEREVNDERGRRLMTTRVLVLIVLIMHAQFFHPQQRITMSRFSHTCA